MTEGILVLDILRGSIDKEVMGGKQFCIRTE
jgi:hypothetical protein